MAGFGIGTKLSSEVKHVAGVIFKACMIDGLPDAESVELTGQDDAARMLAGLSRHRRRRKLCRRRYRIG